MSEVAWRKSARMLSSESLKSGADGSNEKLSILSFRRLNTLLALFTVAS